MTQKHVQAKGLSKEDHFEFGENWTNCAKGATQEHLENAVNCFKELLGRVRLPLSKACVGHVVVSLPAGEWNE